MARLQIKPNGFRVFAKAQAVGAEIHAIAGGLLFAQAANLHRVRQPAGRFDAEIRKQRMARVRVGDGKGFIAGALAAFVDLVRIGRPPVMRGGQFDFWSGFRGGFGRRTHEGRMAKKSRQSICSGIFLWGRSHSSEQPDTPML